MECYCDGHCPDNKPNGTCVGQPGSQCFSAVEEVYNSETARFELERTFGCLPPDESGFMQVCLQFLKEVVWTVIIVTGTEMSV